jgi:ABC-type bacteriocin/lantibiotic exporter with double-glycine peptidase domain
MIELLNEDLKPENQHAREGLSFENNIIFKNVSFRYSRDSPMILNAVSVEIKKNGMIGSLSQFFSGLLPCQSNIKAF